MCSKYTLFIWFIGFPFLCHGSENLTKIAVDFGDNVTLNCSLANVKIYWFIQRHFEPPLYIDWSKEFRNKYSMQTSSLFIHNVTWDKLGSYYCATEDFLTFSNATILMEKGKCSYIICYIFYYWMYYI